MAIKHCSDDFSNIRLLISIIFFASISLQVSCSSISSYDYEYASNKSVYVSIGRPRHWTLDDAHYLLAGVHNKARSIAITKPGPLNPNAFNSSRIKQVESAFSIAARYDELVGEKNKSELDQLKSEKTKKSEALENYKNYTIAREALWDEKLKLVREKALVDSEVKNKTDLINYQNTEITRLLTLKNSAASQPSPDAGYLVSLEEAIDNVESKKRIIEQEKITKLAQQAQKEAEIAVIIERIGDLDKSIAAVKAESEKSSTPTIGNVPPPNITPTQSESSSVRSNLSSELITAIRSDKGFKDGLIPSLNVSDSLENYIDAENELLARQLTLLRNEIGQDKSIVFLELPHSIQSSQGASADKIVQIEWSIDSYCTGDPVSKYREAVSQALIKKNEQQGLSLIGKSKATTLDETKISEVEKLRNELRDPNLFVKLACGNPQKLDGLDWWPVAWDLIPKTNSYNIADFDAKDSEINLAFIFSRIIGLGADVRAKRRKQLFEQFATQDVFASAYGQGESKFGWVLGPRPGSDHVSSGSKTTYAAITAPPDATVLKLKQSYCVLNKDEVISECKKNVKYVNVAIANQGSFIVDRIDYGQVEQGKPATIIVRGTGFSPFQLSILVNGEPLESFNGISKLGRSTSNEDKPSNTNKPDGYFEVTNNKTVVINLKMPDSYVGIPEITMVTPSHSITINDLPVKLGVKGGKVGLLSNLFESEPIFHESLSIIRVDASPISGNSGYNLLISGTGFTSDISVGIYDENGNNLAYGHNLNLLSSNLVHAKVGKSKKWNIILTKQLASKQLSTDPLPVVPPAKTKKLMTIIDVNVLRIQRLDGQKHKIHVSVQGSNFSKGILVKDLLKGASIDSLLYISPNELHLVLTTDQPEVLLNFVHRSNAITQQLIVPRTPRITKLLNSATNNAKGKVEGGYPVVINGEHFSAVTRVLFGTKSAQIVGKSDGVLTVICPAGNGVVPVMLQTDGHIKDKPVTNAEDFSTGSGSYFEYVPKG